MTLYSGSYQIAPMKYCTKPSDSQVQAAWESGDWCAQEKKDGAFYQLEKTSAGDVYMFGRTISKKTGEYTEKSDNFPHIKQWAKDNLVNGTVLIGEIYIPGGKSNDVTKISGCTPENAYKRQFESNQYQPVHYYIFDCIYYDNVSLIDEPTINRINYLNKLIPSIKEQEQNISGPSFVEIAETYYDNFEEHLKEIFNAGGEGMVFKKKDCPYRPGKRTTASQMFKYKEHMDNLDLVCIELLDPVKEYTGIEIVTWPYWWHPQTGEKYYLKDIHGPFDRYELWPITKPYYYGWKNAMRLGAYKDGELVEVCKVASGLTDEMRQDMADNPYNYIGTVIEIECMSVNKKEGTVRHPVFKSIREDKDRYDCKWEEIFNG